MTPSPDVVVMGASAGGIVALRVVVGSFPPQFPATVLVVQHVDPRRASVLPALLARHCAIPVAAAADEEDLRPATVSIAPPATHLIVRPGRMLLTITPLVNHTRPSIDLLFQSAAESYGARVLAVVLTGTGIDGAAGVRAVKAAGGFVIAQDPATAEHRGMPEAARRTGCVDLLLPLAAIGPAIVDAVMTARRAG
jgi:two-component system chemotaxis response regulator CheB